MWGITLYRPIHLGLLHRYQVVKATALAERATFYRNLDSVNNVLARYEQEHPKLKAELLDIEQRIQDLTKGVPGEGRDLSTVMTDESGLQVDQATRFMCRRYYRAISSIVHPDRPTGDAEQFRLAAAAMRNADLEYLQVVYACLIRESDLHWRCDEGIAFWKNLHDGVKTRSSKLRATEMYKVLRAHVKNEHKAASRKMKLLLLRKIIVRKQELEHLILKGRTHG